MTEIPHAVQAFLDQGGEQAVLATASAPYVEGAVVLPERSYAGKYDRVLVAVADRADLRAAVLPWAVRAPVVAVWIASLASSPGLVPRPEWPPLKAIRTQPVGEGYLVVARFEQAVRPANVVRELGRVSVWPAPPGTGGLVVDDGSGPDLPLHERDVPPDVMLAPTDPLTEHHVSGRAPIGLPATGGPFSVGPLDERVLNPIGFEADVEGPVVSWRSLAAGGSTEALVRSLRQARGVQGDALDEADARLVAGLAMAGVPLRFESVLPEAAALLGSDVTGALTAPVDLDDPVGREEHSVVLRRAAHQAFSTRAWSRHAAWAAGTRVAWEPSVTVVLATKRPEMLAFALRQVAKQETDAELQLVLATHGFEPDPGQVRDIVGADLADDLLVLSFDESALFGDVLAGATAAASGDLVLKMDDDDWYGTDFVSDLLLARSYSGAELVGAPAEQHYLVPKDVTVQRRHRAELYATFVAGGTMLVDRGLLREVGSFRSVRKYVDAQLLHAVARAGGAIYRTHGLGYVLRRTATGHTWEVDMDYLLDPVRTAEVRPGFAPSRLLAYDPSELPAPTAG